MDEFAPRRSREPHTTRTHSLVSSPFFAVDVEELEKCERSECVSSWHDGIPALVSEHDPNMLCATFLIRVVFKRWVDSGTEPGAEMRKLRIVMEGVTKYDNTSSVVAALELAAEKDLLSDDVKSIAMIDHIDHRHSAMINPPTVDLTTIPFKAKKDALIHAVNSGRYQTTLIHSSLYTEAAVRCHRKFAAIVFSTYGQLITGNKVLMGQINNVTEGAERIRDTTIHTLQLTPSSHRCSHLRAHTCEPLFFAAVVCV